MNDAPRWYKIGNEDAMDMARNTMLALRPDVKDVVGDIRKVATSEKDAARFAPVSLLDAPAPDEQRRSIISRVPVFSHISRLLAAKPAPLTAEASAARAVADIIANVRDPLTKTLVLLCVHAEYSGDQTSDAPPLPEIQNQFKTVIAVAERGMNLMDDEVQKALRDVRPEEQVAFLVQRRDSGQMTQQQFETALARLGKKLTEDDHGRLARNELPGLLGIGPIPESVAECTVKIHRAAGNLLETYELPRMAELARGVENEYRPRLQWLANFQGEQGIDAFVREFLRVSDRRRGHAFLEVYRTGLEHYYIQSLIERRREEEIDACEAAIRRIIAHYQRHGRCSIGDRDLLADCCERPMLGLVRRESVPELLTLIRAL